MLTIHNCFPFIVNTHTTTPHKQTHNNNSNGTTTSTGGTDHEDSNKVNWGWVPATVLSGGHSGDDGTLDGSSPIKIMVRDVDSEFHRSKIEIPGKEIEEGSVVMANFHGEEDDDG